jgi:ABC-type multidrug transport system fused ATPase/permease subunit
MLKKLWNHLSTHRKKQFWLLSVLMILASIAEIISVGSVLPFLGILTAPEEVYNHQFIQPLIQLLEVKKPEDLLLPLTGFFISAVFMAGVIRIALLYTMTKLSHITGADLSIEIYRRTLYQTYLTHVARNSSEVISGIINKTNTVIGGVISPTLTLMSASFLFLGIMSALFIINIEVAVTALVSFGFIYWAVARYTRQQVKENSQCIADNSTLVIKSLQEGLGGIRDVLIDGSQPFYCQLYRDADIPLRRAAGNNSFIAASPRYAMEALGMILIATLAYVLTQQKAGMTAAIPVLGALALGAQRLLPVLQQAYSAYTSIQASKASFQDVLYLLDQPIPTQYNQSKIIPLAFDKFIELNDVGFRYSQGGPWVLAGVNLRVNKGERIGFVGLTGSGKSTLIDIVMGLLSPERGAISIDGHVVRDKNRRSWQARIAHVPQNIYLSDSTIEENIAFGVDKDLINQELVKKSACQAQLSELIGQWENGYQTFVGERGVRLSGGQRQRIGIARALYKKADVLVLDEATSALDNETERLIMSEIDALDKNLTILIVAHRYTTLKGCDKIVKLGLNNMIDIIDYKDL